MSDAVVEPDQTADADELPVLFIVGLFLVSVLASGGLLLAFLSTMHAG